MDTTDIQIQDDSREYWKPNSRFFLLSITPNFRDDYDADQCWHGCDKVSQFMRKVEYNGLIQWLYSGGGGS